MTTRAEARILARYDDFLAAGGHPDTTRKQWGRYARRALNSPGLHATGEQLLAWTGRHAWSRNTRKSARVALRAFYGWAHRDGLIDTDPSLTLPPIKPRRPTPRPCPDDVWQRAVTHAGGEQLLLLRLAGHCGLRRAEIAGLHTSMLEGDCLRIPGKGDVVRYVPVPEDLAQLLAEAPEGFVFPGRFGGHVEVTWVGKRLSRALGPGWSGHTLRHRAAAAAYAMTRDLGAVQEMLGHASPATTRIYTPVPLTHVRAAVAAAAAASPLAAA